MMMTQNPTLRSDVKLDLRLFEAEQIAAPFGASQSNNNVDGIIFDRYGRPERYMLLNDHPSEGAIGGGSQSVPAQYMIHWFKQDRAGQARGIPEITPALQLFGELRRYTLAVVAAAETAADFAAVLQTLTPADGVAAQAEPMDIVELERRMATVLPEGWQLSQIKAEQPVTTYGEFVKSILNEIARCMKMPFNIAFGNSSGYNYASGRMDHQTYYKSLRVEQNDCELICLRPIWEEWFSEAILVSDLIPVNWRNSRPRVSWFWDGIEHVDPAKEAKAQNQQLVSLTTNLATEYAKKGKDWEAELRQIAKEKQLMKDLGLSLQEAGVTNENDNTDEDEE